MYPAPLIQRLTEHASFVGPRNLYPDGCSPLQVPQLHHSQTMMGCTPLETSASSPDLVNEREDVIGWPCLHSKN